MNLLRAFRDFLAAIFSGHDLFAHIVDDEDDTYDDDPIYGR